MPPCQVGCPTHIDIPGYLELMAKGQHVEAARLVKEVLPFPYALGLVCPAPCQEVCRRGLVEEEIAIRQCHGYGGELSLEMEEAPTPFPQEVATGKRVAVIGAGPAGLTAAYYTDICGIPLTTSGSAALNGNGTYNLNSAAEVGSGYPSNSQTTPDCPSLSVGPPAGVLVYGHKLVRTWIAGIAGIDTIDVKTQATAVAGYLQGACDASEGSACTLLPVTVPVNALTCDDQNNAHDTGFPWAMNQVWLLKGGWPSGGQTRR